MIKVNGEVVKFDSFPDGTQNLKVNSKFFGKTIVITWNYECDCEFVSLALLTKAYQGKGCKVSLYIPYMPYARMDRIEESEDVLSLKYMGELINSLGFKNVFVFDAHSAVTQAVIKNCCVIPADDVIKGVIDDVTEKECESPLIFFPDEGAMKRYSKKINMEYTFGVKKRDWKTGKILGLNVIGDKPEQIKGRDVLIIDDICSFGGTFYHSAKKLKEMGAKNIYLYISHCEVNIFCGEFGKKKKSLLETGLIKEVFTTDSIYFDYEDEDKINVSSMDVTYKDNVEKCDAVCYGHCCDGCNNCDEWDGE